MADAWVQDLAEVEDQLNRRLHLPQEWDKLLQKPLERAVFPQPPPPPPPPPRARLPHATTEHWLQRNPRKADLRYSMEAEAQRREQSIAQWEAQMQAQPAPLAHHPSCRPIPIQQQFKANFNLDQHLMYTKLCKPTIQHAARYSIRSAAQEATAFT